MIHGDNFLAAGSCDTWYTARVHNICWLCSVPLPRIVPQVVPFCRTFHALTSSHSKLPELFTFRAHGLSC